MMEAAIFSLKHDTCSKNGGNVIRFLLVAEARHRKDNQPMPRERNYGLVTKEGIDDAVAKGSSIIPRYKKISENGYKEYLYEAHFEIDGEEFVLVASNFSYAGIKPRRFKFYPGLWTYHVRSKLPGGLILWPDREVTTTLDPLREDVTADLPK